MHTNMSLSQGRQEPVLRPEGRGRPLERRAGTSSTASSTSANDICLVLNAERERLPPARSALRGAQPDQGLGQQPRRHGPHPARQRALARASRSARWRRTRTRTWCSTRCCAPASRARVADATTETKRSRTRFLPDNIYDAHPPLQGQQVRRADLLGEDVQEQVRRAEAGLGRALPQAAGHAREDGRDPVPPRGHEPVPLEHVLDGCLNPRDVERARVHPGSCPFSFPEPTAKARAPATPSRARSAGRGLAIEAHDALRDPRPTPSPPASPSGPTP